jgi:hypothetical protein
MAIFIGQILYHDTENLTEQVKKKEEELFKLRGDM